MMDKKTLVVAAFPATCRLRWLMLSALVMPPSLPVVAMQPTVKGLGRSPSVELAQTPAAAGSAIPAEVEGWAHAASTASDKGDTATALRLQKQVVAWLQANRPTLDGFRGFALSRLSVFLNAEGQKQEALAATEEALKIRRELAKTNEEVLKISRELAKTNPDFLPNLADSLARSGNALSNVGRRQEALAYAEEAVKIRRELAKTNPAVLPDLAKSLNQLGLFYSELGRRQEALAPTEEAVKLYREQAKTNPAVLPVLAGSLNNLGAFYRDLGRSQEALAPTEEALKIRRELAKTNLAFREGLARIAANLAVLQLQLANPSAALPLLRETVSTEVTYLQGQLPLLPEARRLALVEVFGDRWQVPFSLAQQGEAGAALALFTRLNRQGVLQDIQRSQALLARSGPQRPLFEQLTAVTAQLANTTLSPQQQAPLLVRKEQLEQELYRQLPQIQPRLVEVAQIAALLPAGGALVEFQRYRSHDGSQNQYGPPRYLALLLRPDGTIRAIGLGEAAPIDAAVAEAVAASADPKRQAEAPEELAVVSRLVLAPLQRELAGVRELFISPDGESSTACRLRRCRWRAPRAAG